MFHVTVLLAMLDRQTVSLCKLLLCAFRNNTHRLSKQILQMCSFSVTAFSDTNKLGTAQLQGTHCLLQHTGTQGKDLNPWKWHPLSRAIVTQPTRPSGSSPRLGQNASLHRQMARCCGGTSVKWESQQKHCTLTRNRTSPKPRGPTVWSMNLLW